MYLNIVAVTNMVAVTVEGTMVEYSNSTLHNFEAYKLKEQRDIW